MVLLEARAPEQDDRAPNRAMTRRRGPTWGPSSVLTSGLGRWRQRRRPAVDPAYRSFTICVMTAGVTANGPPRIIRLVM